MSKLIVIIGITGNQGSSVAQSFLHSPTPWRIRGLTRSPTSPTSLHLSSLGIEMVYADLNNSSTLRTAFHGASLIFSVTDFWAPFFNSSNVALARSRGVEIGRLAYELEYEQGKNVVDAAAREVEGLDEVGFVASTLCHAGEASGGRYEQLYHFDAKADVFPKYVAREYPALAAKMSFLHTGYFYSSWRMVPQRWLAKLPNTAEYQMQFPTHPDTLIPHLHPREDTGKFVQTLLTLPPGSTLMAASEWCTWPDWIKQWGEVTGMKTSYKQISVQEMDETIPGGAGKEFGEMYQFSSEYGYNASQKDTIMTWDLEKMGIHVPTVSLKEYIRSVDWVKEGIIDR